MQTSLGAAALSRRQVAEKKLSSTPFGMCRNIAVDFGKILDNSRSMDALTVSKRELDFSKRFRLTFLTHEESRFVTSSPLKVVTTGILLSIPTIPANTPG